LQRQFESQQYQTAVSPGLIPTPRAAGAGIRLLLFGLSSPINLGMILRVAETYKVEVHAFDPHGIFADPESLKTISDFACGALQRTPPHVFTDPGEMTAIRGHNRLIATTIEPEALALPAFTWMTGDLLALGNEYDGLPEEVSLRSSARLHIPMPEGYAPKPPSYNPIDPARIAPVPRDGSPNLNVSISAGVLIYSAYLFVCRSRPPAELFKTGAG
jgi:tRNA G18 (ribose-2'-O)-methylase SpoU